jgi:hypothetical protein
MVLQWMVVLAGCAGESVPRAAAARNLDREGWMTEERTQGSQKPPAGGKIGPIRDPHKRLTIRRLNDPGAACYLTAVLREGSDEFELDRSWSGTEEAVDWFAACSPDLVQRLFYVVRRALDDETCRAAFTSRPIEEAAAALYCLAACRLVEQTPVSGTKQDHVVSVPSEERVVCAIIATALFGGELRLVAAEGSGKPEPEHVFVLRLPSTGDLVVHDFERALYGSLLANERELPDICLDDGPLSESQRERLLARIRTIRGMRKACFALVVPNLDLDSAHKIAANSAAARDVPLLIPDSEPAQDILGMSPSRLSAEIAEFWRELQEFAQPPRGAPRLQSAATEVAKPNALDGGPQIQVDGASNVSIAINSGENATVVAGNSNQLQNKQIQNKNLDELRSQFAQLRKAIAELPAAEDRKKLFALLQPAATEVAKPNAPDGGRIKRALDALKQSANALTNGAKIIELCHQAYTAVAPLLG